MKCPNEDFKVRHMKEVLHTMLDILERYDDEEDIEDVPLNVFLCIDDDFWDDEDEGKE